MKMQIHAEYEDSTLIFEHSTKTEQQPQDYSPHFHNFFELLFFKSGDMSYIIDGRKYKLQENMLVIARPTNRHCLCLDGHSDYNRYNILFDEKILPFNIYEKIPLNVHVINFNANKRVIDLFDKMGFYCQNLTGDDVKNVLTDLITEVLYNVE